MDSPQSGFRRAAATSWALAGIGIAGVAGTSALAYTDTVKPQATEAPIVVVEPAPPDELAPGPVPDARQPPVLSATTNDPPPLVTPETTADPPPRITPETTTARPPVTRETQAPEYTPQQTDQPVPAPVTHESKAPSAPPTTRRRNLTPTTVMAPNYSPRVTMSHGS